jgi:hypothetical protein
LCLTIVIITWQAYSSFKKQFVWEEE